MKKIIVMLLCISCIILAGCEGKVPTGGNQETAIVKFDEDEAINTILANVSNFDKPSQQLINSEFLKWFSKEFGQKSLKNLEEKSASTVVNEDWHTLCGNTAFVLADMFSGALDPESENYRTDIKVIETDDEKTIIRIVGDVSFADDWVIAPKIDSRGKGIYGVLSEDTVETLKSADVFLLNNEFTYSTRGTPLSNKLYTFRANPDRAKLLHDIGADIVSLANNHAYDYGSVAFSDTLETLKQEKIPYIGGGENIQEAAKPYYFIINGRKYAFSAATKAEKYILTPVATETSSGVMRTYNPEQYIKTVEEAEAQSDYNIAYLHWGKEDSHYIEEGLYEMGCKFIDAGADIVVGAHAHILQGIQFYKNVPIVYNLGNFIFNAKDVDTGVLEIEISNDKTPTYKFIPAKQKDCYTQIVYGEEKVRILNFMAELSVNVNFDEDGVFTDKQS